MRFEGKNGIIKAKGDDRHRQFGTFTQRRGRRYTIRSKTIKAKSSVQDAIAESGLADTARQLLGMNNSRGFAFAA